jgi:hypothetical protein
MNFLFRLWSGFRDTGVGVGSQSNAFRCLSCFLSGGGVAFRAVVILPATCSLKVTEAIECGGGVDGPGITAGVTVLRISDTMGSVTGAAGDSNAGSCTSETV